MKAQIFSFMLIAVASCSNKVTSTNNFHDTISDVDYVIEHRSGPVLSQSEDQIYAMVSGKRFLMFDGYGANKKLSLTPTKEDVIFIIYCGGTIKKVNSFLSSSNKSRNVVAVRPQPIIASGVVVLGKDVCP